MTNTNIADLDDYLDAAGFDERHKQIAERRARALQGYFENDYDGQIERLVKYLRNNVSTAARGGRMKRRALFVIGQSGTGKSRAIEWHLSRNKAYQPYVDRNGRLIRPLISITSPSPYSNKEFAREIIREILGGVALEKKMTETEWFDLLRRMIREHKVLYLWVDEAQHARRGVADSEVERLQNMLKRLAQMEWPLQVIYSGVEDLSVFLRHKDGQVANRAYVMRLERLTPAKLPVVAKLAKTVIEDFCGLRAGDNVYSEETLHRLLRAGDGCLGTMSDILREACFFAYDRDENSIQISHLKRTYFDNTGCLRSENMFSSPHYMEMETKYVLSDIPTIVARKVKGEDS